MAVIDAIVSNFFGYDLIIIILALINGLFFVFTKNPLAYAEGMWYYLRKAVGFRLAKPGQRMVGAFCVPAGLSVTRALQDVVRSWYFRYKNLFPLWKQDKELCMKNIKNKRLFQGIGIGYVICLITHLLSAILPMYVIFPFLGNLLHHHDHGHGHGHDHGAGLVGHLLTDIIMFTSIIIPVAILTYVGHRLVYYFKCRCGHRHEVDPCKECPHNKF